MCVDISKGCLFQLEKQKIFLYTYYLGRAGNDFHDDVFFMQDAVFCVLMPSSRNHAADIYQLYVFIQNKKYYFLLSEIIPARRWWLYDVTPSALDRLVKEIGKLIIPYNNAAAC